MQTFSVLRTEHLDPRDELISSNIFYISSLHYLFEVLNMASIVL